MASATLEEYLEAIYKLAERGPVRPKQLADALRVSGPTVTATLGRLEASGLIERPEGGVALTEQGRKEALDIIRRHRLAERLLVDVLGLDWDAAHEEACALEHALSPRVMEALEKHLEHPDFCPHGHPIPSADGIIAEVTGAPLCDLDAGGSGEVVQVAEDDDELLAYLSALGLLPGTRVQVCDVAPFHGPLMIDVNGSRYAIGRDVAEKILVREPDVAKR